MVLSHALAALLLLPAADPPAFAVVDPVATLRTAPPQLAPTGKFLPYSTVVVVEQEVTADGKAFVRVRLRDEPRTALGWAAKAALGSPKEFDPAMRPEDAVEPADRAYTPAVMAAVYNARGKYLKEQAAALGVSTAALAAVLKVEASGRGFGPDGRAIVRFENHVFYRRWGTKNREAFDRHFRFDPTEGWKGHEWRRAADGPWVRMHTDQAGEWAVLEFARTLDDEAATASASFGIGQIMGFNHKGVGYPTARAMADAFDHGIRPQLDAMVAFIRGHDKCLTGLRAKDYTAFARGYNGAGREAVYAGHIREAAEAYTEVTKGKRYAE